jgi:hypothetical protein
VKEDKPDNKERWKIADSTRDVQDEYCEWSVTRDDRGAIVRVTFTCEGPEYWGVLAQEAPEKVVDLYKEHVDDRVTKQDLFRNDQYVWRNKWNRDTKNGAMHLIQGSNNLDAEIELAAGATIVRALPDGTFMTDQAALIECSKYGEGSRNSDPLIGAKVNAAARDGAMITLANPVGLYFDGFMPNDSWTVPGGDNPKQFWRYVRGSERHPVRAVFEVPPEAGFGVSDIKVDDVPITGGAQIADFIKIKLEAIAIGKSSVEAVAGCRKRGAVALDGSLSTRRVSA